MGHPPNGFLFLIKFF